MPNNSLIWISIKSIKKSITVMGYKYKLADVDCLELLKQLRIVACQLLTHPDI